jgi:hypothetical protein
MKAITLFAAILALSACANSASLANEAELSAAPTVREACGMKPAGRVRSFRSTRLVLYRACKAKAEAAIATSAGATD